jgi:tetratricopeptide (TPR) repeat protein
LEDVRSALDSAPARSEVIEGGELFATIELTWDAVGLSAEGIARCERYLTALPSRESRLLARLLAPLSFLLWRSGQKTRAVEVATEAVAYARESGDRLTLAWALQAYACSLSFANRFNEAEAALAEAEAIPDTSANFRLELLRARALLHRRGDPETNAHIWEQLRKEHRSLGNTRDQLIAALNVAEAEHRRGQTLRAIAIVRETLPVVRSSAEANALAAHNFAGYLAAVDDLAGAVAVARESIRIHAMREPDHNRVAVAIEHLALVFALRGDLPRAATLEGYVDAAFARHGFEREFTETTTHDRLTALLRAGLSPDELARLTTEGAALSPEAAVALALEAP